MILLSFKVRMCQAHNQLTGASWEPLNGCPNTSLAVHFVLFSGHGLPLWIFDPKEKILKPYAFDSPEALIQPKSARALCHQASTLRGIIRYLEGTRQCHLFPRYKKTCASSLVRMGFHRTLAGGMAARPAMPNSAVAIKLLPEYSALPEQPYPMNVRLPFPVCSDYASAFPEIPNKPALHVRRNVYQKVRKFIRLKKSLDELALD